MSFAKILAFQPAPTQHAAGAVSKPTGPEGLLPCGETLLTAKEVARMLAMTDYKKVYDLNISRVQLSPGRVRWVRSDVQAFIRRKRSAA